MSSAIAISVGGAVVGSVVSSQLNKGNSNAASRANNAAADATALQSEISADQWQRYKDIYSPLETAFVNDAQNYDSPTRYQQAAGDASATVSQQFGKARDRLGRTPGLDASSPAYAASMAGLDLAQAATDATQQNVARKNVTDTAYARKADALSLGKGLPAQAMTGMAYAARTNLGLADAANQAGMVNSNAVGNVVNRVINPTTVNGFKNWLNTPGSAPVGTGSLSVGDANSYVNNYENGLPPAPPLQ